MLIVNIALGVVLGSIITEILAAVILTVRRKVHSKNKQSEQDQWLAQLEQLGFDAQDGEQDGAKVIQLGDRGRTEGPGVNG